MHTCFSNVLSRAFRQPRATASAAFTVSEWLVPALQQSPPSRPFSQSCRRRKRVTAAQRDRNAVSEDSGPKTRLVPPRESAADPEAWVASLEPYLPEELRSNSSEKRKVKLSPEKKKRDIAELLSRSRALPGLDVLSYMAMKQGRWAAAIWIIKTVVEYHPGDQVKYEDIESFQTYRLVNFPSLDHDPDPGPIWAERIGPAVPLEHSLDELTGRMGHFSEHGTGFSKGAIGQMWRSLGNMILTAAGQPEDSQSIMPYVLEILAYLHHASMIPDSVYQYDSETLKYPISQPPALHLLSSRILTALSDAAWGAHEAAVRAAEKTKAQDSFLGHEIPGSRYKVRTPELGPEVWLELVLWSTLHGGWVLDGAAILDNMMVYKDDKRWTVLYKPDTHDTPAEESTQNDIWSWFNFRGVQAGSPDRLVVERTVSAEIITAYVDGLLNTLRVGVGMRGRTPEEILSRIKNLKGFLEQSNVGLGMMTWDAAVVRFLESPGVSVEAKPRFAQELIRLASPFGKELEYVNAPTEDKPDSDVPSYILDASAASLGILHRIVRAHIKRGDTNGGFHVLAQLQEFTDANKMRSMQRFFEALQAPTGRETNHRDTFDSNIPGIEYPAYFPQLPVSLLGSILNLVTETGSQDYGKWLLYTDDIDGPLIRPSMYHNASLASSLIRFGSATRDAELVQKVLNAQDPDGNGPATLPNPILQAFLGSQIENHRWESVANILNFMVRDTPESWSVGTLARLSKQLLLLAGGHGTKDRMESFAQGRKIYAAMVRGVYGRETKQREEDVHVCMCFLASVGPQWQRFLSTLWLRTGTRYRRNNEGHRQTFAKILQGVAETRGSVEAKKFFEKWCSDPRQRNEHRLPGGVAKMPRFRPSLAKMLETHPPAKIVVAKLDEEEIALKGELLMPHVAFLRSIYRVALTERPGGKLAAIAREEVHEVLEWAAEGLRGLSLADEDIDRELDGMLSRGELRMKMNVEDVPDLLDEEVSEDGAVSHSGRGSRWQHSNASAAVPFNRRRGN